MKVSKNPKKVRVDWVEIKSYYPKYVCPSCYVEFRGGTIGKSTLRFRCDCGQELIIENTLSAVELANNACTGRVVLSPSKAESKPKPLSTRRVKSKPSTRQ